MSLNPIHLADLRKSGLSDTTIASMGIESLDGMALAIGVQGASHAQKAYAATGYAIPYLDEHGHRIATRFRIFWTIPTDDTPKYLSAYGQDGALYLPPGLPALLAQHDYVVITEGEKKAAKAVQEGIPCVALAGVHMWFDPVSRKVDKLMGRSLSYLTKPLDALRQLAKTKKLVIAFDSDSSTNPQVHAARYILKDALLYHCADWARVMDLSLDGMDHQRKWGLDDVLEDPVLSLALRQRLTETLAKNSMPLVPLVQFAYGQTADGKPLQYVVPNTPFSAKYNIHEVLKEVEGDDGTVQRKRICTTRVWLSRLVQSADGDNKTLYELGYIPLDGREPKYMSGSADLIRLGRTSDDPLAEHGARVLAKEKPFLEEFLNDCQTYGVRSGKIPRVWGTRRRGWVDALGDLKSAGYVMANRVLTKDHIYATEGRDIPLLPVDTGSDGALREALVAKGEYGMWRDAMRHYVLGAPLPALLVASSMAGLFRRWCPDSENFIVHLYGESSHGKTTAMRAAASCWGTPDKLIDNWRSTDNGLERRCAARNDMVMFLDEAGMAVNEDIIKNSVYMIGNGGEKLRATKDAMDRVTRRFQLVALSTGEKQLLRDSKFAGQEVRALELHAATFGPNLWPTFANGADAEKFNALMNANHGWATERVVQAMLAALAKDPMVLHKEHQHFTQMLRSTMSPTTPAHILRRVKHFGLLLLTWSYILEFALECTPEESKAHMDQLAVQVASHALQLETDQFKGGENEGILQHFMDQLALNQMKFVSSDEDGYKNEIYGLVKDRKVHVIPSGLAKIVAPFDNARVVHIADLVGALVYTHGKTKTTKKVSTRIGKLRTDCYVFDLDRIEKVLGLEKS